MKYNQIIKKIAFDSVIIGFFILLFYYSFSIFNHSLFPYAWLGRPTELTHTKDFVPYFNNNPYIDSGASDWLEIPGIKNAEQLIKHGNIPLWQEWNGLGGPVLSNLNSPFFFLPESILLFKLSDFSVSFFLLFRLFLAGLFLDALFIRHNILRKARILGIVIFLFSGYSTYYFNIFYLNVELFTPALLLSLNFLAEKISSKRLAINSITFAFLILGGNPQPLIIFLPFAFGYFLILRQTKKASISEIARSILFFILALLGGIALTSVIIFPFIESWNLSYNWHQTLHFGLAILPFKNFAHAVIPSYIGKALPFPYIGITVIMIFIAAISSISNYKDRIARTVSIFSFIYIALFILKISGVEPFQQIGKLPLLDNIIFQKYVGITFLLMSMICTFYFDYIIKHKQKESRIYLFFLIQTITLLSIYILAINNFNLLNNKHGYLFLISIACAACIPLCINAFNNKRHTLLNFIIILVAIDLFFNTNIYRQFVENGKFDKKYPYIAYLQKQQVASQRVFGIGGILMPNQSSYYGLHDLRATSPTPPLRYWKFINEIILHNDNLEINIPSSYKFEYDSLPALSISGVQYLVSETYLNTVDPSKIYCEKKNTSQQGTSCSIHPDLKDFPDNLSLVANPTKEFPVLSFNISSPENNWDPSKGDGVTITVSNDNNNLATIFYDPKNNNTDRKSKKIYINLSEYINKQTTLTIRVGSGLKNDNRFDTTQISNFHMVSTSDSDTVSINSAKLTLVYDKEAKIYKLNKAKSNYFYMPSNNAVCTNNLTESIDSMKNYKDELWDRLVIEKTDCNNVKINNNNKNIVNAIRNTPIHKKFDVNFSNDGYLVNSILYYPGWKAYVDGVETKIYPAYGAMQAIPINQGIHTVEIIYRPLSVIIGLIMTIASAIIIILTFTPLKINTTLFRK
jgi:hypothetical protein